MDNLLDNNPFRTIHSPTMYQGLPNVQENEEQEPTEPPADAPDKDDEGEGDKGDEKEKAK